MRANFGRNKRTRSNPRENVWRALNSKIRASDQDERSIRPAIENLAANLLCCWHVNASEFYEQWESCKANRKVQVLLVFFFLFACLLVSNPPIGCCLERIEFNCLGCWLHSLRKTFTLITYLIFCTWILYCFCCF